MIFCSLILCRFSLLTPVVMTLIFVISVQYTRLTLPHVRDFAISANRAASDEQLMAL